MTRRDAHAAFLGALAGLMLGSAGALGFAAWWEQDRAIVRAAKWDGRQYYVNGTACPQGKLCKDDGTPIHMRPHVPTLDDIRAWCYGYGARGPVIALRVDRTPHTIPTERIVTP